MAFEPDIIVSGPDGLEIALVVEVKMSVRDLEVSEQQLKRFMAGMGCPVGLLVTPEQVLLYRDEYLSSSEDSITKVGEFDAKHILNFPRAENALAFEGSVQSWLESMSTESGLRQLSPELRTAAQRYIVPAISQGTIRAAHPR
jgi:hypothetical protein